MLCDSDPAKCRAGLLTPARDPHIKGAQAKVDRT